MRPLSKIRISGLVAAAALILALSFINPQPASSAPEVTDINIGDAIAEEFAFDQAVEENDIDISVNDGIVTLSGTTDNLIEKDRAERIAETVKGVRAVINNIEVDPYWERADREIENDAEKALLHDPATESWELDVEVDDHVATLEGTVDSWQEMKLAEKVLKGVRGVAEINNEIDIDYDEERTDVEIKAEIEEMFRWDVKLDDGLIDVRVDDGRVILSGVVGSAAEKSEAELKSWVRGVREVDSSGLEVERWARDDELRKNKYVNKPDREIEEAIRDALLYDPRVLSTEVIPYCEMGRVTLKGTVNDLRTKLAAGEDARNTVGVVSVDNKIKVRPTERLTDEEIETDLTAAIERDPFLERFEIIVTVVDKTAYLGGTVDSYFEKAQAGMIASETAGVEEVKNNLEVEELSSPLSYDPFLFDYYPYEHDWYDYEPLHTYQSDADIKDEIEEEFFWSPFVDGSDIQVTVDNGEAELSGTVESLSEYNAATENAYEGGAVWVDNDIIIE